MSQATNGQWKHWEQPTLKDQTNNGRLYPATYFGKQQSIINSALSYISERENEENESLVFSLASHSK